MFRITFQLLMELVGCIQQSIHFLEVVVMRHAPAHVLPDVFLRIQLWRVSWQPHHADPVFVLLQQPLNYLGTMGPVIVHKQRHLAFWVSGQLIGARDSCQQTAEAHIVAPRMDHVQRLSGDRIDSSPVPALGSFRSGCQDDPLVTNARPTARDGGQQAQLSRVSQQQDVLWSRLSLQLCDLFFSPRPVQDPAYA